MPSLLSKMSKMTSFWAIKVECGLIFYCNRSLDFGHSFADCFTVNKYEGHLPKSKSFKIFFFHLARNFNTVAQIFVRHIFIGEFQINIPETDKSIMIKLYTSLNWYLRLP